MPHRSPGKPTPLLAARGRGLLAAMALALGAVPSPVTASPSRLPNLVVVLADDLGRDDLAIHGNPHVRTPRLDALGRESARLDDFTVNPVCAPSRATLLTGRHFLRTGVAHVHGGKDFLHRGERTLADRLRAAGYATGFWGKWHLGHESGYHPWERGFDEAWSATLYRHRAATGLLGGVPTESADWADALAVDQAIGFLERNRDRPCFAFVAPLAPHVPLDAPAAFVDPYLAEGHPAPRATLLGMVGHLDHQVGRLLDAIDRLDLARDTIVVFLSDNGPDRNREGPGAAPPPARASGDRGWKGDLYQGGVRAPCFVRWPGRIPAGAVGEPLDLVDLAPTLLDLTGVGDDGLGPRLDGSSFRDVLEGRPGAGQATPIANYAHPGWLSSGPPYSLEGIPGEYRPIDVVAASSPRFEEQSLSFRSGHYKLLLNPDFSATPGIGSVRLVDLAADPDEAVDLAGRLPEVRDDLLAGLRGWWDGIVTSPHAFRPPVVVLRPGRQPVAARVPASVAGGLVNTVTDLRHWSSAGDRAAWRLELGTAARVGLSLGWRTPPPEGARFAVRAGAHAAAETDGRSAVVLDLPAGIHDLEVGLVAWPASAAPLALRFLDLDVQPR